MAQRDRDEGAAIRAMVDKETADWLEGPKLDLNMDFFGKKLEPLPMKEFKPDDSILDGYVGLP
jgi:hypothetical protein